VEGLIWFASLEMLDIKNIKNYCMTYLAFQGLLKELTPYIVSSVINIWVKPTLNHTITLKVVIFRLAQGHSYENMATTSMWECQP